MTRKEAINYCTTQYNKQCERYPQTREIKLALYLKRNVPTIMKWRNSAEYAHIDRNAKP